MAHYKRSGTKVLRWNGHRWVVVKKHRSKRAARKHKKNSRRKRK